MNIQNTECLLNYIFYQVKDSNARNISKTRVVNWETTQGNSVILRLNWLFVRGLFTKQEDGRCSPTHGTDFPGLTFRHCLISLPSFSLLSCLFTELREMTVWPKKSDMRECWKLKWARPLPKDRRKWWQFLAGAGIRTLKTLGLVLCICYLSSLLQFPLQHHEMVHQDVLCSGSQRFWVTNMVQLWFTESWGAQTHKAHVLVLWAVRVWHNLHKQQW